MDYKNMNNKKVLTPQYAKAILSGMSGEGAKRLLDLSFTMSRALQWLWLVEELKEIWTWLYYKTFDLSEKIALDELTGQIRCAENQYKKENDAAYQMLYGKNI